MSEQTATAAPSAAEPSFEIPRSGTAEYAEWRINGTIPEKKQPKEAPAPSATPATEAPDDAADSAATTTQEHKRRRPEIEDRFKKLTEDHKAEVARLTRELEEARKPKTTQAEPSPAKPAQPQNYQEWRKTFKPKEWAESWLTQNKDASYEDAMAAMQDHLGDVRERFRNQEQHIAQQFQTTKQKMEEARSRYQNFDSVAQPLVKDLLSPDIRPEVFAVLNDSPVLADLLWAIGEKEASRADFLEQARSNPSKAIRLAVEMERLIQTELSKGKSDRNEKGQFTKEPEAPAKRGPEHTPEPPLEIGSRGPQGKDESERAFDDIARGNSNAFRSWKKAEDAKELRQRRGA